MKIKTGAVFPNEKTKSFMYETHFHHSDFACSPDEYSEQIAFTRVQEKKGSSVCSWFEDVDGKLIVAGLKLDDPFVRIQVTEAGFERVSEPRKSV